MLGGDAEPDYEQIHRLTYVRQILDESLRLWPTAPMFTRTPLRGHRGRRQVRLPQGHRTVGPGADAAPGPQRVGRRTPRSSTPTTSGPERFKARAAERLSAVRHRACGPASGASSRCRRPRSCSALVLQRFEFVDHRNYQLHTKSTLTVKPDDFWIKVRAAHRADAATGSPIAGSPQQATHRGRSDGDRRPPATARRCWCCSARTWARPRASPTGSAGRATERGYQVTVAALDDHGTDLPTQGAVLIVCSSYNGEPPENATAFVGRLGDRRWPADAFAGVSLHRVRLRRHRMGRHLSGGADAAGQRARAARRAPGSTRAARATRTATSTSSTGPGTPTCGPTSASALRAADRVDARRRRPGPRLTISIVNRQLTNPVILSYEATPALVTRNVELTAQRARPAPGPPGTSRSRCPPACTTGPGDHLGVLPRNSLDLIRRVMRHFGLDAGHVPDDRREQRHPHPPADRRAGAAAGRARQLRRAAGVATRADIDVLAELHRRSRASRPSCER